MLKWLRIRWLVGRYYMNLFMCSYYNRETIYYCGKFDETMGKLNTIIAELEEFEGE